MVASGSAELSHFDGFSDLRCTQFGDSPEQANELGYLVVTGEKTATCSALWEYEAENEQLPEPGDRTIVLNARNAPLCVIETTAVEICRFCDVGAAFAYAEGEDDRSLECWHRAHWEFFTRSLAKIGREPNDEMLLVCERFRVIRVLSACLAVSHRVVQSLASLRDHLNVLPRKQQTLIVGIDGCGGSGKSTFARALQSAGVGIGLVHMDDFYFPSPKRHANPPANNLIGANFDWQRLRHQVLLPLASDKPARYQRYDWPSDAMAERISVEPGGIVVIEGVYSTRAELRDFYDYRVFVDCPRELRIARGVARDGEEARGRWENDWCPAEEFYIQLHAPRQFANLIVDGAGCEGIDLEREFVAMSPVHM